MTLTIELPKNIKETEFDLKMILAGKLFELGKVSSGEAAEMVGISKRNFLKNLDKYGFHYFNFSEDELLEELRSVG